MAYVAPWARWRGGPELEDNVVAKPDYRFHRSISPQSNLVDETTRKDQIFESTEPHHIHNIHKFPTPMENFDLRAKALRTLARLVDEVLRSSRFPILLLARMGCILECENRPALLLLLDPVGLTRERMDEPPMHSQISKGLKNSTTQTTFKLSSEDIFQRFELPFHFHCLLSEVGLQQEKVASPHRGPT